MKSQRGMTLMELVIAFALSIAAGLLLWSVTNILRGSQHAASSSTLVSGETETAIEWLRRDLSESALASIDVFPNAERPDQPPGVAMASNRAYDPALKGKPLVNRWGAPQWDKHVLYTLRREGSEDPTGPLVRWEREMNPKTYLPVSSPVLPNAVDGDKQRVVLRDVLAPNLSGTDFGPEGSGVTDGSGGFRLQFVRRAGNGAGAESLSNENPRRGNPSENTRMLEAELKILQRESGKPHYYSIKFRVGAFY